MRVSAIFCLGFLCFSVNAHDLKIGFIDTEEIVVNLTQYKNSVDAISREFDPKKQELLDLFKHIELLRSNIDLKNNNELELSSLKDLEESFKKETEFWQNAMSNKEINLLNQIEDLMKRTIS